MNMLGKIKRMGRFSGKRADWKKAIVTLAEGDTIDLFEQRLEPGRPAGRQNARRHDEGQNGMAIKKLKPVTPTQRFRTVADFSEITRRPTPEKSLLEPLNKKGGRNNNGRITVRHRGGGHKRRYRKIDFKRNKHGRAGQGRQRSSTTPTAAPASRCCTTSTARSATSSGRRA